MYLSPHDAPTLGLELSTQQLAPTQDYSNKCLDEEATEIGQIPYLSCTSPRRLGRVKPYIFEYSFRITN